MTKKSRQNLKYLENKKRFEDETKSISHHFLMAFIEANETIIFERWEPDYKLKVNENYVLLERS